jgi:hypothetical protein
MQTARTSDLPPNGNAVRTLETGTFFLLQCSGSTPLMGQPSPLTVLRTHYPNSQSVVLEVAKAVGLALKDFHFGVETFGDSVVASEAPHGGNLTGPGGQSLAERDQWSEPGLT